ncbi:MAG TPA: hypothetical protein VGI81_11465 [Tepidisphaeraceae bacterium]
MKHFYAHPQVLSIEIEVDAAATIQVGHTLILRLHDRYHVQDVESIQINHSAVAEALGGSRAGIKTSLTRADVPIGAPVFVSTASNENSRTATAEGPMPDETPTDLPDDEILRRLVALNAERADEERRCIVRWLRPDFQNPTGKGALALPATAAAPPATKKATAKRPVWPKGLAEQARAVRAAHQSRGRPAAAEELARVFTRAPADKVTEPLETLATLGQARATGEGRFVA